MQLYKIQQAKGSINNYAINYRTLAAASGWNVPALLTTYWEELKPTSICL